MYELMCAGVFTRVVILSSRCLQVIRSSTVIVHSIEHKMISLLLFKKRNYAQFSSSIKTRRMASSVSAASAALKRKRRGKECFS